MTTLGEPEPLTELVDTAPTTPGLAIDAAVRHRRLRELIRTGPPLLLPGVVDAIWARLCESRGFDAVYVTGAGVSNSYLSLADVGLLTFPEILDRVERIVEAVQVPVVVDADTGYGGLNFVGRAVSLFERAGVSGIQIEDQRIPKRCGHFDGRRLAPVGEMQARIEAAVKARRNPDVVIIARTDAVGVDGFEAAIGRAHRYREAGADVIFVESPQEEEQIAAIPAMFPDTPVLFNVVPGGFGPQMSTKALGDYGYRVVLHANYLLRSALLAGGEALERLRDQTEVAHADGLLSWQDRQELVRLPELDAFEDGLRARWGEEE